MNQIKDVLKAAFSEYTLGEDHHIIFGEGKIGEQLFHLIGVQENTFLGVEQALIFSEKLIEIIEKKSSAPLLMIVDVAGQALSMKDEWLGMHQYFGHILSCLAVLRQQNQRLISLICNQAIGGAFIAYGLMADTILALPDAKVAVMWLEGMAKVTKIPLEKLQALSQSSPVFAPGIENFKQLGGIHDTVSLKDLQQRLLKEIKNTELEDQRAQFGLERKGRKLAYPVIQKILKKYA